MQDFRRLLVWQRAHALALRMDVFVRQLPKHCPVSLKGQLTRAADSVPTNIVEGCGAASQRELARYLDIAIKSTSETQYHLISACDRGVADSTVCRELGDEVTQIRRMLFALRKKILADMGTQLKTQR